MNTSEIAKHILSAFERLNTKADGVLTDVWMYHNIYLKLNPKEQDLYESAIGQLVSEGFCKQEKRAAAECLVLTESGFDAIYPTNIDAAKKKIRLLLMGQFEKLRSRPNHVIQMNMANNLFRNLNPKEQQVLNVAIGEMVDDGLILFEDRSGMQCFVLTEKGYETLYS